MPRYAAFLRGINLGNRRLKNEQLRDRFERLGFDEVACFRASGNVIFETPLRSVAKLKKQIEQQLEQSLGYEVIVFLRSGDELQAIAGSAPFPPKELAASKGKLQVSLLAKKPAAAARKRVLDLATPDDRLALQGREFYWLPKGGISDSNLDLKTIGKTLGVATMRTIGTIEAIEAKYFRD